ncbi:hypothetical protein ABZS63_39945, partial [Streptomyces sp. NPDC005568]
MRDIAVVAFGQTDHRRTSDELSEVEMLLPVLHEVLDRTGLRTSDIDFTCSGSSDYLAGRAFSFTMALDGVGAWPPISESHVEMDGAWALYEAWTKLLTGDADTALVYGYGKSSPGSVRDVLTRQLDPYYVAPLWPDSVALAALQAQALIDAGETDEGALAAVASRSRVPADHAARLTRPHRRSRGSGNRPAPASPPITARTRVPADHSPPASPPPRPRRSRSSSPVHPPRAPTGHPSRPHPYPHRRVVGARGTAPCRRLRVHRGEARRPR